MRNKNELASGKGELILYQAEDGKTKIEVRLQDETAWLSQKLMAELFQVTIPTINEHIKTIYDDGELEAEATIRKFLIVQTEGSRQEIRKTLHKNEWWFSIVDVCDALTGSADAGAYWRKLKQRLREEGSEVVTFCHGLKLAAPDGKLRETDCANTEGIFRLIQSIPSPKAEPFKRWLAKVGYERVQEIEDPELGTKRTRTLYKAKGYSDDWIEKRMRGIAIREELTDEWKKREVRHAKIRNPHCRNRKSRLWRHSEYA
jgi:hypothetical protein